MSLEKAVKKLLTERATLPNSNMDSGDQTPPKQGSSADAPLDQINMDAPGADVTAKATQEPPLAAQGDAASVRVQAMEAVSKEQLKEDVAALFAGQENIAEGFLDKATSLFEAAVIGRVNAEMINVSKLLEAEAEKEVQELAAALTEQVDAYLTEMVNEWATENKLAIESGLKTEIAESFISGLKSLFTENHIDVPQDKVNVLESLTADLEASKERVNEEVNAKLTLQKELTEMKRIAAITEATKGFTDTDAERMKSLVEGIEFDDSQLFAEKLAVLKEQHFKKSAKKSGMSILTEQTDDTPTTEQVHPSVQRYVTALNRGTKFGN